MAYNYQLVIIGAGSGGLSAADLASQLGLQRVALVEASDLLGGECLHTGCVPSKAMLHAAKAGIDPWNHVRSSIQAITNRSDNDDHYRSIGIDVLHGTATFADAHTITVNGKTITSNYFLIATGSKAAVPKIPGLESTPYHTNETIFDLTKAPKSLTIVGGGPIGCELATAFSQIGTAVTVLQSDTRLLPREEAEVSDLLAKRMTELGVNVLFNVTTTLITKTKDGVDVTITNDDKQTVVSSESLLLATGRTPTVNNLNLEAVHVSYTEQGIGVNTYFQTSQKNIYAIGDCIPLPKFTHLAGHQAGVALRNMLFPVVKKKSTHLNTVPWITYTDPEIGRIGMTESELIGKKLFYRVARLELSDIDRAITNDASTGFIKVLVDKKGLVLGATVVSENASEILTPLAHIFYHKQPLRSLATTVIPYPTLASGLNILAARHSNQLTSQSAVFKQITRKWRKS